MKNDKNGTALLQDWSRSFRIVTARGKLREIMTGCKETAEPAQEPKTAEVRRQLDEYFAGGRKGFTAELDPQGTPFQKEVWKALCEIPYGETRTYKEIAVRIRRPRAYRAVGQAIHNNPIPIIIPCHRVVGSDGSLTGYASGLEIKRCLLEHERRNATQ